MHVQGGRDAGAEHVPQSKDPIKQAAELFTVPLTATAKAHILRPGLRCDSGSKQ